MTLAIDLIRTNSATGSIMPLYSVRQAYEGWIADRDFYAVSPERFDQLLVQKKIPMTIKNGR